MRKQNRNNRICTNEESGKTDFIIDPLLPIGKENAITTQELMRISGCGSSRELRQRIALGSHYLFRIRAWILEAEKPAGNTRVYKNYGRKGMEYAESS